MIAGLKRGLVPLIAIVVDAMTFCYTLFGYQPSQGKLLLVILLFVIFALSFYLGAWTFFDIGNAKDYDQYEETHIQKKG